MAAIKTREREQELRRQIELLQAELDEPRQTVEALRQGQVDAVVVAEPGNDPDVYTITRCMRVSELEDIARAIQEGTVDALVMRGEDGQAVFTLHTVQEALRLSEERLRVAIKNSKIIVHTTDRDLRYTWIENPHPSFKPEEIVGKRDDELLPPEVAAPLLRMKQQTLDSGVGCRGEFEVVLAGRRCVYDVTIEPLRDLDGAVIGLACAAMEITERKALEEERARSAEQLARALEQRTAELNQAHESIRRTEALAMLGTLSSGIAHDLGNLLFPLRTRLSVLRSQKVPRALAEDIDAMARNVEYIADLSTRLRQSMSGSSSGHATVQTFDLFRWCRDSEQFFRTVIPDTIKLECTVPPNLPTVTVDRIGLTQAVYNLIQNSIKAMRHSGVGERIIVHAHKAEPDHVVVCIEDDGAGMPPEVLSRCLEPGFTTDKGSGGTGLGLPLVKAFVDAAGGAIEVASPPPGKARGTIVMMRLPSQAPNATSTRQAPRTPQTAAIE